MDTNPAISPEVNQSSSAPIQSFQSAPSNSNPPTKKSGFKKWIILGIVVILLLAVGMTGGYFLNTQMTKNDSVSPTPTSTASNNDGEQVACTMDAKECPDGSFVSRQGPSCEFAECPTTDSSSTNASDWKTYTNNDNNYSIKYPKTWKANPADDLTEDFGVNLDCALLGTDTASSMITVCFSEEKFDSLYPEIPNKNGTTKSSVNNYVTYKINDAYGQVYILNTDDTFVTISKGTLSDQNLYNQIINSVKFN